jgi:ubiquinone biosynthesis protein
MICGSFFRSIQFYYYMNPIIAEYNTVKEYTESLDKTNSDTVSAHIHSQWQDFHNKNAVKIYNFCKKMGGFYIKVCQVLTVREDVPIQYKQLFVSFLHENVPKQFDTFPYTIDGISEISKDPIGSASIGQVHTAKLYGSDDVVVKIKYPNIEKQLQCDFYLIRRLVHKIDPASSHVADEIINECLNEVDFYNESYNIQAIHFNMNKYSNLIVVPKLRVGSSNDYIVMDMIKGVNLIDGTALNLFQKKSELYNAFLNSRHIHTTSMIETLLFTLIDTLGHQIFNDKLFHADMHPGNIMITNDGYISLIDFGLVKRLDPTFVYDFKSILFHINNRNYTMAAEYMRHIGFVSEHGNIEASVNKFISSFGNYTLPEIDTQLKELELVDKTTNYPTQLIMLLRSTNFIRSIAQMYGVKFSFIDQWQHYYV